MELQCILFFKEISTCLLTQAEIISWMRWSSSFPSWILLVFISMILVLLFMLVIIEKNRQRPIFWVWGSAVQQSSSVCIWASSKKLSCPNPTKLWEILKTYHRMAWVDHLVSIPWYVQGYQPPDSKDNPLKEKSWLKIWLLFFWKA